MERGFDMNDILFIDLDSIIPNLAIAKLSRYHKNIGDDVGIECVTIGKRMNVPSNPDKIYVSGVFKKNKNLASGIPSMHPGAECLMGGVGLDMSVDLPKEIEFLKPDYDLYYPNIFEDADYSLGFTTRGCSRACYFCYVYQREGKFRWNQHPKEFYDERFDKIRFLDNNVLYDRKWFHEVMSWCNDLDLMVEWNQGLDVRLLQKEDIEVLAEMKTWKTLKFAFDDTKWEKEVMRGIDWFKEYGYDTHGKLMFYVYVHDDAQHDDALQRAYKLRERDVNPYIMLNIDTEPSPRMKKLKSWVNDKSKFWGVEYVDYNLKQNLTEEEKIKSKFEKRKKMVEELYGDSPKIEDYMRIEKRKEFFKRKDDSKTKSKYNPKTGLFEIEVVKNE